MQPERRCSTKCKVRFGVTMERSDAHAKSGGCVGRSDTCAIRGRAGRRKRFPRPDSISDVHQHQSARHSVRPVFGRSGERDCAGNDARGRPDRTSTSATSATRAPISSFDTIPSEVVLLGISVGASVGMMRYSDIRDAGVREIARRANVWRDPRLQLDARCAAPIRGWNGDRRETHSCELRGARHEWDSTKPKSRGGSRWASRSSRLVPPRQRFDGPAVQR